MSEPAQGAPPPPAVISSYEEIFPLDLPDWDGLIAGFKTRQLFHSSAWLRFLQASQGASIRGLRLFDRDHRVVGYFVFGEVRKGPFRLLGSPLQGWAMDLMGPIVDDVEPQSLLRMLDGYARARGAAYIELANPHLPPAAMRAAGYQLDMGGTPIVTIDNEAAMWKRMDKKSARYCIKRATKNGLRVERTADRAFIHEYYLQLQEVFSRQGLVPIYGEDRVRSLWDALMPAGRMLCLRVWNGEDLIATGLFPYDEGLIYFWGGAAHPRAYSLYPYEIMHWHVMQFALEKNIPLYNLGGGIAQSKRKYGGEDLKTERWYKSLSALARIGRRAFKQYIVTKQRVMGLLRRKPNAY